MPYAIVQRELVTPEPDVLAKAFRTLPILTDIDAHTASRDAFGILMRGLNVEDASRLHDALLKQNVGVEVADEAELPVIPPSKVARQVELLPSSLRLYDPMGRMFNLTWNDILLVCAGNVRLHEFKRVNEPAVATGISPDTGDGTRTRESAEFHFLLDIVLNGGIARYCMVGDEFDFTYLGARRTPSLVDNFSLLVRDIAQAAPHAGLNRGAFLICEKAPEIFTYPGKAAFFEEMIWMLWQTTHPAQL